MSGRDFFASASYDLATVLDIDALLRRLLNASAAQVDVPERTEVHLVALAVYIDSRHVRQLLVLLRSQGRGRSNQ